MMDGTRYNDHEVCHHVVARNIFSCSFVLRKRAPRCSNCTLTLPDGSRNYGRKIIAANFRCNLPCSCVYNHSDCEPYF